MLFSSYDSSMLVHIVKTKLHYIQLIKSQLTKTKINKIICYSALLIIILKKCVLQVNIFPRRYGQKIINKQPLVMKKVQVEYITDIMPCIIIGIMLPFYFIVRKITYYNKILHKNFTVSINQTFQISAENIKTVETSH